MIRVEIRIHAYYVQTCVRFIGDDTIGYVEHSVFGATMPKKVFSAPDREVLYHLCTNAVPDPWDHQKPYLFGFPSYATIRVLLPDDANLSQFEVEEARWIDPKRGGRDVKGAFRDEKFKRPILNNLLSAVADKDVEKVITVFNALDKVGA